MSPAVEAQTYHSYVNRLLVLPPPLPSCIIDWNGLTMLISLFLVRFYRAMHMHKRGICQHAVSVCLSVTFVSCAKTNKGIFEFFSPCVSQAILVFPYQTGWRYSDGNPPNGGRQMQVGYRQKSRFWSNSWLSMIAGRANYEVTKTVTDDHAV